MKQETNKTAGPEAGGTSGQSVQRSKFRQKSQQEQTAAKSLDAAISANTLTAEETGWAKLLRYYLANPNDGYYADYPKTPAELTD